MRPPAPRGPLSARLLTLLAEPLRAADGLADLARQSVRVPLVRADEDVQLSLLVCQELDYDGIDGADERWECAAGLLAARRVLEDAFEAELRTETSMLVGEVQDTARHDVAAAIFALTESVPGPPLARHLHRHATRRQLAEFLMLRSVYHLKEADPHTWLVPRLRGAPKAALLAVQIDEYGSGRLERMHAELFADTMRLAGLDPTYGAYVDKVPAATLAVTTAMSMFGRQRRLRGATAGHLAAFEATSSLPNRRYGQAVRRLGLGDAAAAYFDEHVEADAVHEQVATRELCAPLVGAEPDLLADVLFGAAVCLLLDAHAAEAMLGAWRLGRSSLLPAWATPVREAG